MDSKSELIDSVVLYTAKLMLVCQIMERYVGDGNGVEFFKFRTRRQKRHN